MSLKRIYQIRFNDRQERKDIWRVLVNDFFQRFIDKNDTVVDVGCGYGEFINQIRAKRRLAVDLNPEAVKFLAKKVRFFLGKSTKMPFIKNDFVDKIFISNFFEHLTREDIVLTIKEFKRILKKRGQVLILQPNIRFLQKDYWMFFDHLTPVDDRALEETFGVYGFKLKKRILKFLPYTTKSRYPQSPYIIKLYLKLSFLWPVFGRQSFLIFEKS